MKKLLIIMVVCACIAGTYALHANAQRMRIKASNRYITRDIPDFRSFDAVRAEGVVDIEYRQSADGTISVKAYGSDNVLDYLEVVNEGGTLVARLHKDTQVTNGGKLKVIASGPALKRVSCSGASDIDLMGSINTGALTLEASGAGDITFNSIRCDDLKVRCSGACDVEGKSLTCNTFNLSISGSGDAAIDQVTATSVNITTSGASDVEIAGTATEVTIKVSGVGEVDAFGLRAETVRADASGASEISCYATKRLDANASGISKISYGGKPASVNVSGTRNRIKPR